MKLLRAVDFLYKEAHSLVCDMMLPSGMWTISVYFKVCMIYCSSQPDVLEIPKKVSVSPTDFVIALGCM